MGRLSARSSSLRESWLRRDHRTFEFAREDLQGPTHLTDLDLAILGAATATHELQVVDDDDPEVAVLLLDTTGPRAHVHDGERRVVVDEDLGRLQEAERLVRAIPVRLAQVTGTKLRGVDARRRGEDALGEFLTAHLEREEQRRSVDDGTHVDEDPEREGRLAGCRSGADDRHRTLLQSLEYLVERAVPGLESVQLPARLAALLEDVGLGEQQALEWRDRVGASVIADRVDLAFGLVDETDHVVGRDVGVVDDLASDRDRAGAAGPSRERVRRSAARSRPTACSTATRRAPRARPRPRRALGVSLAP